MTIDGIDPLGRLNKAEQRTERDVRSSKPAKASNEPARDTVEVSSDSQISNLAAAVSELPEVRTERIEALQAAINDGSYNIPSDDIAAKIIEELI